MTDDVTRGLELLADEAEPAPIDTHAVVAMARARRNSRRAVAASAFVTVAAVGALAVTVGAVKEPTASAPDDPTTTVTVTEQVTPSTTSTPSEAADPDRAKDGPVLGTEVEQPASPEERTERAKRLQGELVDAFDRILPQDWDHSAFAFACDSYGCWAQGDIVDGVGPLKLFVHVSGDYGLASCSGAGCSKEILDDGTLVALSNGSESGQPQFQVSSVRTDGTAMSLLAEWKKGRATPPLTEDQWRDFGNVLTY